MNNLKRSSLVLDGRLINTSGIGTVCQNILPFLIDNFELTLMGNPAELKKHVGSNKVHIISFKSEIYTLKEQIGFLRKVPACDFFFSPHYNIPLLPIRAKKRIVIIHDVNHIALKNNLGLVKKAYANHVVQKALHLSDYILTVSNFSRSEILKYFKLKANKKIDVIPLGVDKSVFKKNSLQSQIYVKDKYKLPEKFLLYVGNVKPHKNLQILIKAYYLLKSKGLLKEYKLLIVGKKDGFITKDNEVTHLISTLNLSEDIYFTGFVNNEDLPVIYNLASLFVFPSLYEGFGLPPIEAMACGCPVLVSKTSSLPEVCKEAAVYFNPLNEYELSDSIINILNDDVLRRKLKEEGFQLSANYNWSDTAKSLKKIICN